MKLKLAIASTAVSIALLFGQASAQNVDQSLRARLPKSILDSGELVAVNNGSFPPYEIVGDDHALTGASADLWEAIGGLLGLKIRHETVSGLAAVLAGIKSGRYQLAAGPVGDYPEREPANDFVDWVQEFVVFAVQKGNPTHIGSIADTCGQRVSVMAAGSAEKVIKQQSEECVKAGKPAVEVQSFTDQATSILAVRSRRADAFFSSQAPLVYFVSQTNGQLTLAGTGQKNGFEDIFQGTVVPKDSALGAVVLDAFKILFANGTYAKIMKKWGLEGNMLQAPGLNLATKRGS